MKRVLTGLQPTGNLTLGNYIGSISQMKIYQDEYESFIFVADMHSITIPRSPEELRTKSRDLLCLYLACGIDKDKNTFFIQSQNLNHTNLAWILECNTPYGQLTRMTQFKDKSQKGQSVTSGLFTYPVLMASDILLYDANLVPTGIDQKQHVELARDIAINFNKKYGDTFVIPEPCIQKIGANIMDLQNPCIKMSKSNENPKGVIYLMDDEETIRKKFKSAVTDSDGEIYYDVEKKAGISNLLTIYSCMKSKSMEEVCAYFKGQNYGTLKNEVAQSVIDVLIPIQKRFKEIRESNLIEEILKRDYSKVFDISSKKLLEVKEKVGFLTLK